MQIKDRLSRESWGLFYGFIGVCCFSLTLPATRIAVTGLNPLVLGLGRSLVASVFAALILIAWRQPLPARSQMRGLLIISLCLIIIYPVLLGWIMHRISASHAAIVGGVAPLATAIAGALRAHERPTRLFWFSSLMGSATVVAFALRSGAGRFQVADLALIFSVFLIALVYAEGGILAREMGGVQVICWSLVFAAGFLIIPVILAVRHYGMSASPAAWLGFWYLCTISILGGYCAWYKGLALGGIARVGQVQLLQPFLTLFFAAQFMGEKVTPATVLFALSVVVWVAVGRKATVTPLPLSSEIPA